MANLAAHGDSNNNNAAVGQEAGALEALVQLTQSPHEGVKQEAAGALWNLSFDDKNRESIAAFGGVEALVLCFLFYLFYFSLFHLCVSASPSGNLSLVSDHILGGTCKVLFQCIHRSARESSWCSLGTICLRSKQVQPFEFIYSFIIGCLYACIY